MIYLTILSIAIEIVFVVEVIVSARERRHLSEMLASKDYSEYKNLENEPGKKKEHINMYTKRARKEQAYVIEEKE